MADYTIPKLVGLKNKMLKDPKAKKSDLKKVDKMIKEAMMTGGCRECSHGGKKSEAQKMEGAGLWENFNHALFDGIKNIVFKKK